MNAMLAAALIAVYSHYPSGRPRLVVKATHDPDDLLLLRYADAPHAKPRVVAREELDSPPDDVSLEKVIDPKDVVVSFPARHGSYEIVDRIVGDRFVQISDAFGDVVDLDGDGIPEIISQAYAGQNECGVYEFVSLLRWNGKRFVDDERRYVTALSKDYGDDNVRLSADKRYAVRLFGPGRVMLDDKEIAPGKPFHTEEDCHTIALHGGTARTRAFLEELPR